MAERPKPLVAGNWKMNGRRASMAILAEIGAECSEALRGHVDLLVCPPATLLYAFFGHIPEGIVLGGQDCHASASGAFTGDISAEMLADLGAAYVIVGHSERRSFHAETDDLVRAKAEAASRAGLMPIVCVGETQDERQGGRALDVVAGQLRGSTPAGLDPQRLVVAYEPVWAIGTGLTPTAQDVAEVHAMLRRELGSLLGDGAGQVRLLYGGSVKPSNAAELLHVENVDGALVGGASLVAADFLAVAGTYLT